MSKVYASFIIVLLLLPSCFSEKTETNPYKNPKKFNILAKNLYVEFETSMRSKKYQHKITNNNANLFSFFKHRYEINSFNTVTPRQHNTIPKIFHYIWLGAKLPDEYRPFLATWLEKHPDWRFIFWVDNPENYDLGTVKTWSFDDLQNHLKNRSQGKRLVLDVKNLIFDNRIFFDTTKNYGQRSDILKWEVVYRFGGVYIDVDFECIKPLDILNYMYDFYTGIQPLDTSFLQLGAALFAARPGHPILKHCVESIKDDWHKKQIIVSTGPLHFTKSFYAAIGKHGLVDVALPASYFYPCGYDEKKLPEEQWLQAESFAVHHWAGSWLKPEGWEQETT